MAVAVGFTALSAKPIVRPPDTARPSSASSHPGMDRRVRWMSNVSSTPPRPVSAQSSQSRRTAEIPGCPIELDLPSSAVASPSRSCTRGADLPTGCSTRPCAGVLSLETGPGEEASLTPGGITAQLLRLTKPATPRLPRQLRVPEAALIQMAPHSWGTPCNKPTSCCWRWAACELLEESTSARAEVRDLRAILDEELGDSAMQRYEDLRDEFAGVSEKVRCFEHELDAERQASATWRMEYERTKARQDEALVSERLANMARKTYEEENEQLKRELAELQESSTSHTQRRLAEAEQQTQHIQKKCDEELALLKKRLDDERRDADRARREADEARRYPTLKAKKTKRRNRIQ